MKSEINEKHEQTQGSSRHKEIINDFSVHAVWT